MTDYVHAPGCTQTSGEHIGPCPIAEAEVDEVVLSEMPEKTEMVDHPAHYGGEDDPYETIKVIEAWMSPDQVAGFCLGNAIKYVSRAGKKDALLQDLKKARWYLDRYLEYMEKTTSA